MQKWPVLLCTCPFFFCTIRSSHKLISFRLPYSVLAFRFRYFITFLHLQSKTKYALRGLTNHTIRLTNHTIWLTNHIIRLTIRTKVLFWGWRGERGEEGKYVRTLANVSPQSEKRRTSIDVQLAPLLGCGARMLFENPVERDFICEAWHLDDFECWIPGGSRGE